MRLVYITATFPYVLGSETFLRPELATLHRFGHEVLLAPRQKPFGGQVGHDLERLAAAVAPGSLLSPRVLTATLLEVLRHPIAATRATWRVIRAGTLQTRLKNALVVPRGIFVGVMARRMRADHIHAHWASTTATIGLLAHEVSGVPWSFTAHRGDIAASNLFREKAQSAMFVRFISVSGAALAHRLYGDFDDCRHVVIHMGVTLPALGKLPRSHGRRRERVFCAANLLPVKGHRYLLEAMKLLKDDGVACELALAGDGILRSALERAVDVLGLRDRVEFLGAVPHAEVLARYRRGDVDLFVLPSVDLGDGQHEGIPVSLMEAMAHCIPVIATATGGIPELLRDGAGEVVAPEDPAALAGAIARLLRNRDEYEEYADRGRSRVAEGFDVGDTTKRLVQWFDRSTGLGQPKAGG